MDKYHQLARIAVKAECDECYLTALQFWQKAIKTKEGILHKEWVNKRIEICKKKSARKQISDYHFK
ncbi:MULTISPECIES: ANR family transcriptional regulator [Enterobacterales]|uniref:ANR family transcriptional regulator n=1 Tax=Enterobacterales TaxID=91347 RepID=UPI001033B0B8|nr:MULTISPECIES: ANR family transcriptional regulator [Enterobacterales]MCI3067281.1 ANR family transcriptional regulator [Escherichia coli]TBL98045.1 ANR family transcriptional regulator [Hafnia paralvei]